MEPFGEDRQDLRAAYIAYTIACTVPRGKNAGSGPKFEDFVLKFAWEEKDPETPEQIAAKIKAAFAAYGTGGTQTERVQVRKGQPPQ